MHGAVPDLTLPLNEFLGALTKRACRASVDAIRAER
jgi:hypothetical protein